MNKEAGFSLIELLVVITIMGILLTLSIPAYRNFNEEQSVNQAASKVKDDIQFGINKSAAGINAHWYGITFQADSAAAPLPFGKYSNIEVTPKSSSGDIVCPTNVPDLGTAPCSAAAFKKITDKQYPTGVKLDKIILYDQEANPIDYPSFIDVRFNQSPESGQIVIGSTTTNPSLVAKIARVELQFKNGTYQRSLVIDGGNICDETQVAPASCNNDLSGGPRPSRVFVVEK